MNEKLKNMLLPVAITLAILVVLEIISRLVLHQIYDRGFEEALLEANKYGTTIGLHANTTGKVMGKEFHTDEMGGRKHAKTKAGKKFLIIGDSVAEGIGVNDDETFANLLNEKLPEDVRNISHQGWAMSDYKRVLQTLLSDTSISKVALFYCLTDIYGDIKTSNLPKLSRFTWLGKVSGFLQKNYTTYQLLKLFAFQNSDHYFQYCLQFYKDEKRVMETINTFVQLQSLCKSKNVSFQVYILPYRSQLKEGGNKFPQQTLAYHLGMNGIPFYDLLPALSKEENTKSLFLFADEIHLSTRGHAVVAHAVLTK